jgi:hypothetical protein
MAGADSICLAMPQDLVVEPATDPSQKIFFWPIRCPRLPATFQLKPKWNCTKYSRQRRHVQKDLPLKAPRRGSGKSKQSQETVRAGR